MMSHPPVAVGGRLERRAFTLLELLLAIAVFAVVLSAINGVFWGALRLRNKTSRMLERSVPVNQAMLILRRDLAGIMPPGGTFAGQFKSDVTSIDTTWGTPTGPEIRTTTGRVDDLQPWGEVQKIVYYLRPPTNGMSAVGFDLLRVITRNLAPALAEEPVAQTLMSGVTEMNFEYYDGSSWRTTWDSTTETTVLPRAIRVQMQLADQDPEAGTPTSGMLRVSRKPLELVVPLLVRPGTNQTQTAATGTTTP
jgi:general secretion pathway protein J